MTEGHRDRLTAVTAQVASAYGGVVGAGSYVVRMAQKAEILLDETTETLRATRSVVEQLDHALGVALPVLATFPSTQDDVRQAREAAEHLVGLVNTTIVQLDSLPGAKLVRRRMTRAAGGREPASLMP
jgi:hypothetical protein